LVDGEETQIFALVAQGQRDQAKKRLLDLIITTAKSKDFHTAERLRERLYEIDSLALGEIIRAGEIIEQEKRGAIKGEDLEIWAELTDRLSSEEFQAIYHEFVLCRYKPEETIVSQGDKNDALFFINQGSVKVSHLIGPRELFITSLNRGQIAGENFFTPSFWTVTLTSLTPSSVYILPQPALNAWQQKFPGLRTKLHDFYNACNNIRSMLEKKGLERRKDQRFTLSRKIQVQPINNLDTPIGRGFRAETADISLGGLAFLIRISKQENARLLLGRRMQVVLPIGGKENYLHLKGLVIGIQPFHILENDYSVHFRFDTSLEPQGLQNILG
jgi:CRP-like cAMP-binding protein